MKADLDRFMEASGIDVLLILPSENEDPYRAYLSNGAFISGMVIKKRGAPPILIVNGMEKDEAAKSGLTVYTNDHFDYNELMLVHGYNTDEWQIAWLRRIFDELDVRGKLAVYGVADVNAAYRTILNLQNGLSDRVEIVTDQIRNTVFDRAYETKDADEITVLRDVARRTSAVMRAAREWIGSHRAGDGVVLKEDGSPLTIGDVKQHVRGLLFQQNLEDAEGMIFAQGRDGGVPHSKGEDNDPLRLGESIVFDLYPRAPGGYFHDMTRTWSIGYAKPEVLAAYNAVMEAYDRSVEACKPGVVTCSVQQMVCEYFESLGHPTVMNTPGTAKGYVHTLAHGVGLNVHETPFFPTHSDAYHLQRGNVFTIEPGLYYPDEGYGVRIEDTVHLNEQGALEILTDCPYDLVIELKNR